MHVSHVRHFAWYLLVAVAKMKSGAKWLRPGMSKYYQVSLVVEEKLDI